MALPSPWLLLTGFGTSLLVRSGRLIGKLHALVAARDPFSLELMKTSLGK